MTNEEAIKRLNKIKAIYNGMDNKSDVKALDMAIESLEQEPILDKIRAEIEAKCCITVGRENDPAITLYDVFEIIDKYKAEKTAECDNNHDCEHCDWTECPLEVETDGESK